MSERLRLRSTAIIIGSMTFLTTLGCGHRVTSERSLVPSQSADPNQVASEPKKALDQVAAQTDTNLDKLKCSIAVEEKRWSAGKPATVSMVVENVSGSKLDLKVIPAFRFVLEGQEAQVDEFSAKRNQYWGPLNIKQNRALGLQEEEHINLEKGESMRAQIDLTTLKWERAIGAVWPSRDLFTTVSAGRYQLFLDIAETEPYAFRSVGSSKVPLVRHALSNTLQVVIE